MSDVVFRTDGKRGRWKVSKNRLVYSMLTSCVTVHA